MKYEITYAELANIYNLIARADSKIYDLAVAGINYRNASDAYAASDYKPSAALEMHYCYETREKAEKALLRIYSQLADALGLDKKQTYGDEGAWVSASKRCTDTFLYIAKREALRLAKLAKI